MASVTAMPLKQGWIAKGAGAKCRPAMIHCDADGDIKITWEDGTNDTVSFLAGEDRSLYSVSTEVEVVSGKFSFDF